MNYTDSQLKQALAKLLPEQIGFELGRLLWLEPIGPKGASFQVFVLDTELLHLCRLVEQTLSEKQDIWFLQKLFQERHKNGESGTIGTISDRAVHASWQQRVIALAKVKGVEI